MLREQIRATISGSLSTKAERESQDFAWEIRYVGRQILYLLPVHFFGQEVLDRWRRFRVWFRYHAFICTGSCRKNSPLSCSVLARHNQKSPRSFTKLSSTRPAGPKFFFFFFIHLVSFSLHAVKRQLAGAEIGSLHRVVGELHRTRRENHDYEFARHNASVPAPSCTVGRINDASKATFKGSVFPRLQYIHKKE